VGGDGETAGFYGGSSGDTRARKVHVGLADSWKT
jgi:hypothetical protein